MNVYVTGYAGGTRTAGQLIGWKHYTQMEDEFARRVLGLMDYSIAKGKPVGIGGSIRTTEGQERLFLSRHHVAAPGEPACCRYQGRRYALDAGEAHAAPPGLSYHEDTVLPSHECLASDLIGNMRFVTDNALAFGLREFRDKGEPWHVQPIEVPAGRSSFILTKHYPLKVVTFPGMPAPQPAAVEAPRATLTKQGHLDGTNDRGEVRELQAMCNFWKWRDALGRDLIVDGDFGPKTEQAVMAMQVVLKVRKDGLYGPRSQAALQGMLDYFASL